MNRQDVFAYTIQLESLILTTLRVIIMVSSAKLLVFNLSDIKKQPTSLLKLYFLCVISINSPRALVGARPSGCFYGILLGSGGGVLYQSPQSGDTAGVLPYGLLMLSDRAVEGIDKD